MPVAISSFKRKSDGQGLIVTGKLALSGTYPGSGDAVDFSKIAGLTNRQPDLVLVAGSAGFVYQYDYANKKLWTYCNTAGGANNALGDHTNAGYVAGVTGDDIRFLALWLTIPGLPTS